jgi:hypothetical protein
MIARGEEQHVIENGVWASTWELQREKRTPPETLPGRKVNEREGYEIRSVEGAGGMRHAIGAA